MSAKRARPNPPSTAAPIQLSSSLPTFNATSETLAQALVTTCLSGDLEGAAILVSEGAECWWSDTEGWTSLHAAASSGNLALVEFLLRKGNAVWNLVDVLGNTAGDIAFSLNEKEVYDFLTAEGVRAELLKSVIFALGGGGGESDDSDEDEDDEMIESNENGKEEEGSDEGVIKLSTAGDNKTFLSSKLIYKTDADGQEICEDREGNGVMMGWEKDLMRVTADLCCEGFKIKEGVAVAPGEAEEDEREFRVVNVGFGLGIIDTFLQAFSPTFHLIIEPHPDVLAHAKTKGWYELPGVRFYEGTWQDYLSDLESEKEEAGVWDVVYFDTYSEKYEDLHAFFDVLPNWLRDETSRFSFFNGLGATGRSFYDIYTTISEIHLREIGLSTEWHEVDLSNAVAVWDGVERRYWGDVGPYRLPVCKLLEF